VKVSISMLLIDRLMGDHHETEGASSLQFISLEDKLELQVENVVGCSYANCLTPLDNVGVIVFTQVTDTDSVSKAV
jgi:hypothetical protein